MNNDNYETIDEEHDDTKHDLEQGDEWAAVDAEHVEVFDDDVEDEAEQAAVQTRRSMSLHIASSIPKYEGIDPFAHRTNHFTAYERTKRALLCLSLVPLLRFVVLVCTLLWMWFFALLATLGLGADSHHEPLPWYRHMWWYPIRFGFRTVAFFFGFHWMPAHVEPLGRDESQRRYNLIIANHVGMLDMCKIAFDTGCSFVAKAELFNVPFIGRILRASQSLPMYRNTPEGRARSLKSLQDRISDERFPPLLIFPEGTTSNDITLTTFARGAFVNGNNVLPCCLSYRRNVHYDCLYGFEGSAFWYLVLMLTQVTSYCDVTYLSTYVPNEQEKKNYRLYANNVRLIMANRLNATPTEHSFFDVRMKLMMQKKRLPEVDFVARDVHDMYNLSFNSITTLSNRYKQLDLDGDGVLSLGEFCVALNLKPTSVVAQKLFRLFDSNRDGSVDFREFITAIGVCTQKTEEEDQLRILFTLCDSSGHGHITKKDMVALMSVTGAAQKSVRMPALQRRQSMSHARLGRFTMIVPTLFHSDKEKLDFDMFVERMAHHDEFRNHMIRLLLLNSIGGVLEET